MVPFCRLRLASSWEAVSPRIIPRAAACAQHARGRLGVSEPDSEEATGTPRVDHQAGFGLHADFRLTGPAPGSPAAAAGHGARRCSWQPGWQRAVPPMRIMIAGRWRSAAPGPANVGKAGWAGAPKGPDSDI